MPPNQNVPYLGEMEPHASTIEIGIFDHEHTTIKPIAEKNVT